MSTTQNNVVKALAAVTITVIFCLSQMFATQTIVEGVNARHYEAIRAQLYQIELMFEASQNPPPPPRTYKS